MIIVQPAKYVFLYFYPTKQFSLLEPIKVSPFSKEISVSDTENCIVFLHDFKIELSYLWQIKYIWKYFWARKYREKMTFSTRGFQESYWELRMKNVLVKIYENLR